MRGQTRISSLIELIIKTKMHRHRIFRIQRDWFSLIKRNFAGNKRCQSCVGFLNTAQYLVIEIHVADSLRRVAMVASFRHILMCFNIFSSI